MNATHIEWCDYTSNPIKFRDQAGRVVWGCVKVSEGCKNCYAEALAKRYGKGAPFAVKAMAEKTPFVDEKELKTLLSPRALPAGSKVFIGDMTDIFGEWVTDGMLDRLFAVFALRPDVVFQLLTKRPERMRAYLTTRDTAGAVGITIREVAPDGGLAAMQAMGTHVLRDVVQRRWPLPNVWLGTSVEDQEAAEKRIPELLATPAAVRFLSCEPLLGPVDLDELWLSGGRTICMCCDSRPSDQCGCNPIDWVIVGGESGGGSRPMDVTWARSLVTQCRSTAVACFVKQLGSRPRAEEGRDYEVARWPFNVRGDGTHKGEFKLKSPKGGDWDEWPADLRVRQFPGGGS